MNNSRILDERIDQLTHVYRLALDAGPVNTEVDRQLSDMGRTATVSGFRKGKAPLSVLRNRFGDRIRQSVVDRMAIEVARQIIAEKVLQPIRRPEISLIEQSPANTAELELELTVEVAPRVELDSLEGLALQRLAPPTGSTAEQEQAQIHLRRQLFDVLMARHDFPVPGEMVERERTGIEAGYQRDIGGPVDADLRVEFARIAERRIRLAILLTEIGRVHNIHLDRDEVTALIAAQAQDDDTQQAELIDYYLDHPSAMAELQSALFEDRVVAFLLAHCDIEEVQLSADGFSSALDTA
ncbi:hypothetical protein CWI75_16195 [Kineobactrum sediminis]|uniref:Uncharacterized protein n=1 Tax=Kineobactrum sediminis TaxID=1905677 RepID=A0A2N5XZ19_9GAMM|nr:trigger factor [Kineobactrum sediminis]PLW81372.1 hypothetical protein CWI75_16195 [Kineobactrum sediminis]